MNRIVEFFKEIGFYDEDYFRRIEENTKVYNKPYDEIKEFVGCYPIYNEKNEIIDFKLILPKLDSIDSELIYVHEYTHALFLEDESELFPNIMEALYISCCIDDVNGKECLLNYMEQQIYDIEDENHRIGLKAKILFLREVSTIDLQEEIKDILIKNKEVLLTISLDMIWTYIKLFFVFPKQKEERIHFVKQMSYFRKCIIEEVLFLQKLSKNKEVLIGQGIYNLLDDLTLAFEQDYLYYDGLTAYMERAIQNKELHFHNFSYKEAKVSQKIKFYQSQHINKNVT